MITDKKQVFLLVGLLAVSSLILRTYRYTDISLDYDEHKSIYTELKNTSFRSLANYLFLQNALNYRAINQRGIEVGDQLNICFPLYYLPLKLAALIRHDISFLRLFTTMFGVLTPVLVFWVGKRYRLSVGVIAALLVLFHPWAQQHSVHIRFYEFWALLSVLGLWYVEYSLVKIRQRQTRAWQMIGLAAVLLLPCTVHAFGVLSTAFMTMMILTSVYAEKLSLREIPFVHKLWFGVTGLVLGVIIGVNLLVFGYTSVIGDHASYTENSESALHILLSAIFNFGYFHIGLLGVFVLVAIVHRQRLSLPLKRYSLSFLVSVVLSVVVVVKPHAFRPDFFYGLLPYVCLFIALIIEYLAQSGCKPSSVRMGEILLAGTLILSTFPTFVSNEFIDFDRLNFVEAAKIAAKLQGNAALYSSEHNYMNVYLETPIIQPMHKMNPEQCSSGQDEYFFVSLRKGKSIQFGYDVTTLQKVQLVEILGKSRIDHRMNSIFVFFRRCGNSQ